MLDLLISNSGRIPLLHKQDPPGGSTSGGLALRISLIFIRTRGFHKEQADQQCDDIEHDREVQHVLVADGIDHITVGILDKASRIAHDQGCDLVAGKTRKRPRRKGDTVNRADAAHAVMVGKQGSAHWRSRRRIRHLP